MGGTDLSDSQILNATVRIPEHVVFRAFEAETLLLNLQSGQYHGLNATGGRMLELLDKTGDRVRDCVRTVAEEYSVGAEAIEPDMTEFCRELVGRGLIELVGDSSRAGP